MSNLLRSKITICSVLLQLKEHLLEWIKGFCHRSHVHCPDRRMQVWFVLGEHHRMWCRKVSLILVTSSHNTDLQVRVHQTLTLEHGEMRPCFSAL